MRRAVTTASSAQYSRRMAQGSGGTFHLMTVIWHVMKTRISCCRKLARKCKRTHGNIPNKKKSLRRKETAQFLQWRIHNNMFSLSIQDYEKHREQHDPNYGVDDEYSCDVYCAVIEWTPFRENPRHAILSVLNNSEFFSEVRIWGNVYEGEWDESPPYDQWHNDRKDLEKEKIKVHFHRRHPFSTDMIEQASTDCDFAVDIPSRCNLTPEVFGVMDYVVDNSPGNITRWSLITNVTTECSVRKRSGAIQSFFADPIILLLTLLTWFQAKLTWKKRVQSPKDVRISTLTQSRRCTHMAPESKWAYLIPWIYPNRHSTIYTQDGCHLVLPDGLGGVIWFASQIPIMPLVFVLFAMIFGSSLYLVALFIDLLPFIDAFDYLPRIFSGLWFGAMSWIAALYVTLKYTYLDMPVLKLPLFASVGLVLSPIILLVAKLRLLTAGIPFLNRRTLIDPNFGKSSRRRARRDKWRTKSRTKH